MYYNPIPPTTHLPPLPPSFPPYHSLSLHSLTLSTLIFIKLPTLPLCQPLHSANTSTTLPLPPPVYYPHYIQLLSSQHFATECCVGILVSHSVPAV
ncbi:hypothetical protein Pmani_005452 [Petrolisthes manimaculis]|uniref:Uncharacterized protein n=1 Tax=Petrolisthes manimaculis TaxID=1843537 RepID=A0AAE1UM65_9EUCA|nr:hypothetical protein Pmani_005452 [Petrolisthes manimaculis]